MYTREHKEKALAMYDATQSIAEVIRRLGYPSKQALYTWIANRDKPWQKPNGTKQFIPILNDYLIWYREKRIKLSLHSLSPIEYRRKLGPI